jgi:hypothetical protein
LVIVLLIGVVGGFVFAAASAARRVLRVSDDLAEGNSGGVVLTRATAERVGVGIGDGFTLAG